MPKSAIMFCTMLLLFISNFSWSSDSTPQDLTHSTIGYLSVALFLVAYGLVMMEEVIKLRKSKPVLIAAGLIWAMIGITYHDLGQSNIAREAIEHNFLEYAELMLFLLVAMTYINAMEERRLFDVLKTWMISRGFHYKTLFWLTGGLSFFISPIADNLTTALLMCAVLMKVGGGDRSFINLSCINVVIAANAGGAFSPFGDITTLMVWQTGLVSFNQFFLLLIPAAVNYLVPALIMSLFITKGRPEQILENTTLKRGAKRVVALFLLTIFTAVIFHSAMDFPPVIGMMMGLGYLQLFGFYLKKSLPKYIAYKTVLAHSQHDEETIKRLGSVVPFDVFQRISHAEWDTLLFFYGVVMCVGGLSLLGYLHIISQTLYSLWDPIWANVFIGLLSAIVDNIPVMFAVITMNPDMNVGNWLLITLTAGVGGSLLSIGSAAGVALMGAAQGKYTFIGHLKWTPVILLGYVASIIVHLTLNQYLF
jgi:NhaD family Na+/H+ antiporter